MQVTTHVGCMNETNCGADVSKRCLPHVLGVKGLPTLEACAR